MSTSACRQKREKEEERIREGEGSPANRELKLCMPLLRRQLSVAFHAFVYLHQPGMEAAGPITSMFQSALKCQEGLKPTYQGKSKACLLQNSCLVLKGISSLTQQP